MISILIVIKIIENKEKTSFDGYIKNCQLLRLYDDIRNPSSVKLEKIPHNCQKNMTFIFLANRIMRINELADEYSHQNYIILMEY